MLACNRTSVEKIVSQCVTYLGELGGLGKMGPIFLVTLKAHHTPTLPRNDAPCINTDFLQTNTCYLESSHRY